MVCKCMLMSKAIDSWQQFDKTVRYKEGCLLRCLGDFKNPILVSGCQRSGTTILSRILRRADGMADYCEGGDDELEAALILCGRRQYKSKGRCCFQTTYVNNCYREYLSHSDYKLIWVLRNPYSVVYSMLHNWRLAALNRLFKACGSTLLEAENKKRYQRFGSWAVSKVDRACLSYNAKLAQLKELWPLLDDDKLLVFDYDDLVAQPSKILPKIYDFVGLPFKEEYTLLVNDRSVDKVSLQKYGESSAVSEVCMPVYRDSRWMLTIQSDHHIFAQKH